MKVKKVFAEDLSARGACETQVKRFKRKFPKGAALTKKNAVACEKSNFSISFLEDWLMNSRKFERDERALRNRHQDYWASTKRSRAFYDAIAILTVMHLKKYGWRKPDKPRTWEV